MHYWFYFFATFSLYALPLMAMWANRVLEPKPGEPFIAVHKEGDIMVISEKDFGSNHVIKTALYDKQLKEWGLPVNLSSADLDAVRYRLATDPKGNIVVFWQLSDGECSMVQAAIFSRETNLWSPIRDLSEMEKNIDLSHLGMDESGNILACWTEGRKNYDLLWIATYAKEKNQWTRARARQLEKEDKDSPQLMFDSHANSLIVKDRKNWEAVVIPIEQASNELLRKAGF